jgi:hypothetical protein
LVLPLLPLLLMADDGNTPLLLAPPPPRPLLPLPPSMLPLMPSASSVSLTSMPVFIVWVGGGVLTGLGKGGAASGE